MHCHGHIYPIPNKYRANYQQHSSCLEQAVPTTNRTAHRARH